MFSLTVVDHVRLDAEHVTQNYVVHARAAERIVGVIFMCRITITALLAVAASATIANLLFQGRAHQIVAVVASALALFAFATYELLGFGARLFAHRSVAHRLWLVSERYRSLLSEVNEGFADLPSLVRRRDELINEVHTIYEFSGFGIDQPGYEVGRLPALPDERAA